MELHCPWCNRFLCTSQYEFTDEDYYPKEVAELEESQTCPHCEKVISVQTLEEYYTELTVIIGKDRTPADRKYIEWLNEQDPKKAQKVIDG